MQRHYCEAERCWLDFEEKCAWCDMTEEEAKNYKNLSGNKLLDEVMYRMAKHDDGRITDD